MEITPTTYSRHFKRHSAGDSTVALDAVKSLGGTCFTSVAAGTILVAPSDEAAVPLYITQGLVRCFLLGSDGREFLLRMVAGPAIVGLASVFQDVIYPYGAQAMTLTRAAKLSPQACRSAAQQASPHLALLMRAQADELAGVLQTHGFLTRPAEVRLAYVLLEYVRYFGRQGAGGVHIRYPLTQVSLANQVGAVERSIRRILQRWRREGWISNDRGWMVIHDVATLSQVVNDAR